MRNIFTDTKHISQTTIDILTKYYKVSNLTWSKQLTLAVICGIHTLILIDRNYGDKLVCHLS